MTEQGERQSSLCCPIHRRRNWGKGDGGPPPTFYPRDFINIHTYMQRRSPRRSVYYVADPPPPPPPPPPPKKILGCIATWRYTNKKWFTLNILHTEVITKSDITLGGLLQKNLNK